MRTDQSPSGRHVTRRILHGLGANAYGQLVVIVIQLAGVPILLRAWGMQLYGEWLILAAIPTYLSMADLGFSQSAATTRPCKPRADNVPGHWPCSTARAGHSAAPGAAGECE